ncbi:MAG TPA: hypothetical protein VNN17_03440 [Terriglobia bacterium]|nr:hypothetical protein [Terriglobia bacterium]
MKVAFTSSTKRGGLALFLFCLPFCAIGLGAFYFALHERSTGGDGMAVAMLALFGLIFSGAGFGLLYASVAGSRMLREQAARMALHPGQPWMRREDWAAGKSKSNARTSLTGIWVFAVLWNLISSPILFIRPPIWQEEEFGWIALLFPAIGAVLLSVAVVQTLRMRRYGRTWFRMDAVPAKLGGELRGFIEARFSAPPPQGVRVKLTCVRRTVSGAGKNRNVREEILWREEQTIPPGRIQSGPESALIPVQFAVPRDGLETSPQESDSGIFWFLAAEASVPGLDYRDEFEVPVFGSAPTQPAGEGAFASPVPLAPAGPADPAELARTGIIVRPAPDGTEFLFKAARNKGAAIGITVFFALWTAVVSFIPLLETPGILFIIFGLIDLVLLLVVLHRWFGSTRLVIGGGQLHYRYSLLGIPVANGVMPASDISKLTLNVGMQSGGRSGTAYYDIRAVLLNGKEESLAGGIADKRHGEWLVAQMSSALGL